MTSGKYALSVAVLSISAVSFAAPFAKWFTHTMADGRAVRIWGEGDEYAAHFEDEAGRTLIYNPEIGNYEYSEEPDAETQRKTALARMRDKAEETGIAERWAALKERTANAAAADAGGPLRAPPSHTTDGTIVGITLLVDFPLLDADGNETNTLAAAAHPNVTANDLDALINGDDFTKYGNASSVRGYYAKATSGHVDYTNAIIGWIKAPHTRGYYDDARTSNGTCGRRLIGDILDALVADPRYETEFRPALEKATVNSSGEILALNVLFAGEEASTWSYGLWAHQYVLTSTQYKKCYVTIGGKKCHFYSYQISPVTSSPTIHTFCHESGHMICDFPDLYAYSSGLGNGVGMWCIMSGRVAGGDTNPPNFCAYLRAAAGWVSPKTLPSESGWVTVKADLQDVWKFPHPTDKKQYYLIENRQATGTDALIQGSGIVIYRCDESGDNTTGAKTTKSVFSDYGYAVNRLSYEVSVEQADGLYEIERDDSTQITLNGETRRKYNGDPDDCWFEGNGAALYAGQFNSLSTPCARWTDGTGAKINLSAFSESGETMTFWSEVESSGGGTSSGSEEEIDLSGAIYVNGISTKTHSSYENSSSALFWRVTDGRIVLRGSGPYLISGTGTMPIRCAADKDDYANCKVILSNVSITSQDEDNGTVNCGSAFAPVQLAFTGTNRLTSVAYSEKKSRPAIYVESGQTLTMSGTDDAVLYCTGGKYAAGIGGGYSKGLISTSGNDCGSIKILGGTVVANGGYYGAGIGGGNGGGGGRLDVFDSLVEANGGAGAAGIGGGYKGVGTHFFNYSGTVWAKGGLGDGSTPDIGRGADKTGTVVKRLYISGGSTTLANGYVTGMMTPSNATERVCRTVTGNLTPGNAYTFSGLPSGYGQNRIVANANGEVHLWLPNGTYSYSGGEVDYTATVAGGKTTASGSSEYGCWLKRYSFISTELPTAAERKRFETTSAGRPFVKRKGGGEAMTVWDEYVAGTDPDKEDSILRPTISMDGNGNAVVGWEPDLNEGGAKSIRKYTIYGVEHLGDAWHPRRDGDRFFKVGVEMP